MNRQPDLLLVGESDNGLVLKTACGRHLVPAVRAVLAGKRCVTAPLVEPII